MLAGTNTKMTYEHVNLLVFWKKNALKPKASLLLTAAFAWCQMLPQSPHNVLLKKTQLLYMGYVFILYWYIYVFIYITESFLMKVNFSDLMKCLHLFLHTNSTDSLLYSHIASELGLGWWTKMQKTMRLIRKLLTKKLFCCWPAAQAVRFQERVFWFKPQKNEQNEKFMPHLFGCLFFEKLAHFFHIAH